MMRLLFAFSLVLSLGFTSVLAQNELPCYIDQMYAKKIAENPQILQIKEQVNRELNEAAEHIDMSQRGGVSIIPVVFHVIHQNGAENISKAQILDGVRVLNEDFRFQNADASEIVSTFTSRAADTQIEFRLATKDPNGNCTDGIVRVYSPLTADANDNVKELSGWPNTKYLNIWVVESIENDDPNSIILGYAYYPDVVTWGSDIDGILIRSDAVGQIGTSSVGRTLTHEVGHYLGLPHTFENGCSNGGDGISDTPPTATSNFGCNLTLNSCHNDNPDIIDNVQNHMDYSNCRRMFTTGQSNKMNSTFNVYRSSLISNSNINATGALVSPAPNCAPVAEFLANTGNICAGNTVTFTDHSWNGTPTQWNWSFPGGTPATSSAANPTITYNSPGTYNVTLTVSNVGGSDSETKTSQVTVSDGAQFVSSAYYEGFEDQSFSDNWTVVNPQGTTWVKHTGTSYTGSACAKINTITSTAGSVDELISPSYDLSATSNTTLTFKLAYTQRISSNADRLRVFLSSNCGESWTLRFSRSGSQLATVPSQSSPFTPTSQSDWEEYNVTIPTSIANGNNVRIKFEFTSDGGNQLYLDDINLGSPVGIREVSKESLGLNIYPNPTGTSSTLNFDLPENEKIDIYATDLVGRRIELLRNNNLSAGQHQLEISKEQLGAAGIYLITLKGSGFSVVEKLVVY